MANGDRGFALVLDGGGGVRLRQGRDAGLQPSSS